MPVHIYRGMKHFQLTGVRPVVCVAHSHEIAARKAVVLNHIRCTEFTGGRHEEIVLWSVEI